MSETAEKTAAWLFQMEENWQKLQKEDQEAKNNGTLVNRYIQEGVADGYAIYKIIRENRKTVRIRVVTGLGDDWQVSYWGAEATIEKSYAEANIRRREGLAELFGRKAAK